MYKIQKKKIKLKQKCISLQMGIKRIYGIKFWMIIKLAK